MPLRLGTRDSVGHCATALAVLATPSLRLVAHRVRYHREAVTLTCRSPVRPGSVRLFAHQTWGEQMRCGGNGGMKATSAGPKAVFALVRDAREGVPKAA